KAARAPLPPSSRLPSRSLGRVGPAARRAGPWLPTNIGGTKSTLGTNHWRNCAGSAATGRPEHNYDRSAGMMRDPQRAPTAKLPRIEDAVKAGGFLCGDANDLIEHIKALEKRYPALDRISVSLSVGVPEKVALEQLRSVRERGDSAF